MILITEIDPLDLAEILGQVGGFWDLILFVWPLFFVAASYEAPHLKPRNFRKSVVRATETVTKVLPTTVESIASFTTELGTRRQQNNDQNEELPTWEREGASSGYRQVHKEEIEVR